MVGDLKNLKHCVHFDSTNSTSDIESFYKMIFDELLPHVFDTNKDHLNVYKIKND